MSWRDRTACVVLVGLAAGCSAGKPATESVPPAAAALAASHGSAAEVRLALETQGLACVDEFRMPDSPTAEQLIGCRIGQEQVVVAHFLDAAQAERFQQAAEAEGRHGAFASTWAVQTASPELAERVGRELAAASTL